MCSLYNLVSVLIEHFKQCKRRLCWKHELFYTCDEKQGRALRVPL